MLAAMPASPDAAARGSAVPGRGRADACPGALRLHTADDGALARVRLPGGLLTARQLVALADAAEQLGDGAPETTSRGNVQLRGLPSDCGAELARRLREAGLLPSETHERVRNIVASPYAGVDGRGHADVQGWVRALDAELCASGWAAGLSGKFLFALDDGRGDVAALDADVTLIAAPGGTALLRLGRAGTVRPVGAPVAAALAAARDFLAAAEGRAWHLRELPDLLPPGTEPLPAPAGGPPALGALPGGIAVGTRFGRAAADRWRLLAEVSAGEIRLTPWRGAVLPGVPAARLPDLAAAGFLTRPGTAWDRATACTGLPGCAKSLADVRTDAARALEHGPGAAPAAAHPDAPSGAARAPERAGGAALPVHWSGCERRCGHPAGRWVDVLALGQGYRVTPVGTPAPSVDVTTEEMAEAVAEARRIT
ncbi:hypothetical protein [Kitasatospora sp. NE20-6]|uniref:hypothetical protein n=1 Tax=Kitasatospora sp. NE20-6 TaxID=2859066 RepID=UPI0038B2700E